jgi:hypothetical protein
MSEEKKAPELPELGPDGLPVMAERSATFVIVQDKTGGIYINYPEPLFIGVTMLAQAGAIMGRLMRQEYQQPEAIRQRSRIIVPALLNDPKYQRRH